MFIYLLFIVQLQCLLTVGQNCLEPENITEVLLEQMKHMYQHPDFMLTRDFLPSPELDINVEKSHNKASLHTRHGTCNKVLQPSKLDRFLNLNLNQISTCPWTMNQNVDPNRIPVSILEAVCNCDWCMQYDSDCSRTRRQTCYSYTGRCEKVFTSKLVIMRDCNQTTGVYEYYSGLLPVAIGCTCSRDVKAGKEQKTRVGMKT